MIKKTKITFATTVASLALIPCAAFAAEEAESDVQQDADVEAVSAEDEDPNVIIVTAQKREETLTDVPISIQVLGQETIQEEDLRSLADYVNLVPSLWIEPPTTAGASGGVTIRGIGALGGINQTWALYVDGFDTTGLGGGGGTVRLADAERIEVLRGPQGTAFGRNVIAGAISITSETPDPSGVSGRVTADIGNNDTFGLIGSVNLPITDNAAVIVSGFYDTTDAQVRNIGPSGGNNGRENYGGRIGFYAEPTDRLQIKASLAYEETRAGNRGAIPDGEIFPTTAFLIDNIVNPGFNPFFPPGSFDSELDEFFPDQNDTVVLDLDERSRSDLLTAILRFDYDFGDFSLVSITGYNALNRSGEFDEDASQFDAINRNFRNQDSFVSTELRLQSNGDNRFDWVVGGLLARTERESLGESVTGDVLRNISFIPGIDVPTLAFLGLIPQADLPLFTSNELFIINSPANEVYARRDTELTGEALAIFADGSFEVTDRLTLQAGIRYNYDRFEERVNSLIVPLPLPDVFIGDGPGPLPEVGQLIFPFTFDPSEDTVSTDELTWRVSATYDVTDDLTAYASVSTGYRPGGPQLGNVQLTREPTTNEIVTDSSGLRFLPETITNYEAGIKGAFGRTFSFSLAGFFMDWEDVQFLVNDVFSGRTATGNAVAEVLGVELEMQAAVGNYLTLSTAISYTDTEVTDIVGGADDDARIGLDLPNAPEWGITAIADYQRPIADDLDMFARTTFSFTDARNDQLLPFDDPGQTVLDSFINVDLRFGLERPDNWRLEGFVTNLFDEIYATAVFNNAFSLNGTQFVSPPGRQFGLRVTKEFN